nr:DNA recombination protein RmuC [synthetic construct]
MLSESRQAHKKSEALLENTTKKTAEYKELWEKTEGKLSSLQDEYRDIFANYTELKTTLEQRERNFAEQFQQLENNKEVLTKEFERLASQFLEEKGQKFKQLNSETISNLLTPIQSEMKGFKDKVEKIHERDVEQRIQLKAELENLQKLNQDITDKAEKLTTALQGQKKVQGNWGELMLENVLDGSGLRLGTDYKREVSFNTEDEGRKRPDAIVYLPQNKHMVIDAKTSLAAYTRYVNSEDEFERKKALKEHTQAVSDRINELSDRNYYKLPGLNSPEIVVMFIPIESAYVEALKSDETLYQRAIERNVLVATPTTLLTSLNIVRQLWRFEDQNKHTAELANRAEKFYDKLRLFLTSMQEVGKKLDQAKVTYDKALGQLHSGKGNLIKQASEFKDLGVAVKTELPVELTERASLELDQFSTAEIAPNNN